MTSTTANTTAPTNAPAAEVFFAERRMIDDTVLDAMGAPNPRSQVQTIFHKVGVGFETKSGNLKLMIGQKKTPTQRKALVNFTNALEKMRGSPEAGLPVADIHMAGPDGYFDFSNVVGHAFLNADGSLNVIIGDKEDTQVRYVVCKPSRRPPVTTTEPAAKGNVTQPAPDKTPEPATAQQAAVAAEESTSKKAAAKTAPKKRAKKAVDATAA